MSTHKTTVIVLCSFIAAAVVCIVVGLVLYLTSVNLPASESDRGARILAGIIVMAVGGVNGIISLAALAFVSLKRSITKNK